MMLDTIRLGSHSYAKQDIRVMRLGASPPNEMAIDLTISTTLRGGIDEAYETGDNSRLVTSDSLKNLAVDVLGKVTQTEPEEIAVAIATATQQRYGQFPVVEVSVVQSMWRADGAAFVAESPLRSIGRAVVQERSVRTVSGFDGLSIMVTKGSRFVGFVIDEYTTGDPINDRPLTGAITAEWSVADSANPNWREIRTELMSMLVTTFGKVRSESVQHLLALLGRTVLDADHRIEEISLAIDAPRLVPTSVAADGSRIYAVIESPRGVTEASLRRSEKAGV